MKNVGNFKIYIYFFAGIVAISGFYLVLVFNCKACRNEAIAECNTQQSVLATELAQTQTAILVDMQKKTVPERRQIMQRWVIK